MYHRTGLYPLNMPASIGMEAAGVVEAVGEGVTHLAPGDRAAYASNPPGSYCEARVMPAKTVCKLPDAISFETGAAMMLKGLTAQYLLKKTLPVEGLQPGDFMCCSTPQRAAWGSSPASGPRPWVCSSSALPAQTPNASWRLANGAAHAINYSREDFAARVKEITGGKGVKVVYDSVGKDTWDKSLDCLRPFGLMASFGNASGPVPAFAPGQLGPKGSLYLTARRCSRTSPRVKAPRPWPMTCLPWWPAAGQDPYRPALPLADVQQAHRDLEARKTTGCTILTL